MSYPDVFSAAEKEQLFDALLKKGLSPARARKRMAEEGIRWEYQFLGQGRRERLRRLKQEGRALCKCGRGSYWIGADEMCSVCLEEKWSPSGSSSPSLVSP